MPISDELFSKRLKESQPAVDDVARYLRSRGAVIEVPEMRVRPSYDERYEYQDDGDIKITQRVEIRWQTCDFTCCEDYPYPTIPVGRPDLLGKIPKLQFYGLFSLNRERTHAAVILNYTRKHWQVIERFVPMYGHDCTFVVCPKELAYFVEMAQLPEEVKRAGV